MRFTFSFPASLPGHLGLGALLLLLAAPAAAQTLAQVTPARPAPPASPAAQARVDELTNSMNQALRLTPAQLEKVRAINTVAVRKVEEARGRYRQEPAKLRTLVEDIGLARLERLKDVLTPDQFARYQARREEKMGIPKVGNSQGNQPPGLRTGPTGE